MDRKTVVELLTTKYPDLLLKSSDTYYWSPSDTTVFYKKDDESQEGVWALLHESGHALLGHSNYYSDFELVKLEVEAWEKAKEIALAFGQEKEAGIKNKGGDNKRDSQASAQDAQSAEVEIDEDHVQDCLDSYREWLHKRSLCPDCHLSSIQVNEHTYSCIFCSKRWKVTAERFCRPYRKKLS